MLLDLAARRRAVWRNEGVRFYVLLTGEASALGSDQPVISG
jgi:hypothetical protein